MTYLFSIVNKTCNCLKTLHTNDHEMFETYGTTYKLSP